MKKETLENGLAILRHIDYSQYRLKKLEEKKLEYQNVGYFRIESSYDLDIKIPFEIFEPWFDSEIEKELNKIEVLQKELDEL